LLEYCLLHAALAAVQADPSLQIARGGSWIGSRFVPSGPTTFDPEAYSARWAQLVAAAAILVVNLFLVTRLVSQLAKGLMRSRLLVLVLHALILVLPLVLLELLRRQEDAAAYLPLIALSPGILDVELAIEGWQRSGGFGHYML